VVTDQWLPALGRNNARQRGEPVSDFMLTDDEKELRDRAWRFLSPAVDEGRYKAFLVALRVTRVIPAGASPPTPDAYYAALIDTGWRSSLSPYHRLIDDITADWKLLDPYFAVLARVEATDAIRARALTGLRALGPQEQAEAEARIAENRGLAWWVADTLRLRIEAYRRALDRLVVEIPDPAAVSAERALRLLEARAADGRAPVARAVIAPQARRSYHPWPTDETVPQK
jgi:hypothetical protein